MKVKPVLGDWVIPRIESISTMERRSFVELPIPGRAGSLFQDLNKAPTHIVISGSLFGDDAREQFLESLRGKFSEGNPVTFVADILTATEVQYVVIEDLRIEENSAKPDQIDYFILLKESPPPPPASNPLGGIDAGILDQAQSFLDSVTGALDVIDTLGSVPDFGNPTEPLSKLLDDFDSTTSALPGLVDSLATLIGEPEP